MSSRRIVVSLTMLAKEFSRRRVTMALMFLLPTLSFVSVYSGLPKADIPVDVIENQVRAQVTLDQRDITGSFIVLTYAAFMGGLTGLFLTQSGRTTDRRLMLSGYRASELTLARSLMLTVICIVLSFYLTAMLLPFLHPRHLFAYFSSVFLTALIYGSFGAIVGTLITQELGGILAVFFLPSIDVGWLEIPGFSEALDEWWAMLLPGFFPSRISVDAAFTPTLETFGDFWPGLGYAAILWMIAMATFARVTHIHRFAVQRRGISWKLIVLGTLAVSASIVAGVYGTLYYVQQPKVVEADGRVSAADAQITSLYNGRIRMLTIDKGDRVQQNAVVAWIEDPLTGTSWSVSAPMAGSVTDVLVHENENVVAGTPLAVIYDLDHLEVRLEVDESSISEVEVGLPVSLRFSSITHDVMGRVKEISRAPLPPETGASEQRRRIRKYSVTVELLDAVPDLNLEIGVHGKILLRQ